MKQSHFDGRLVIEEIQTVGRPFDPESLNLYRSSDERGEFCVFLRDEAVTFAECIEIKRGGARGNHFHTATSEVLYVAAGRLLITAECVDSRARLDVVLEKGARVSIKPGIAHAFHALEESLIVSLVPSGNSLADRVAYKLSPPPEYADAPQADDPARDVRRES